MQRVARSLALVALAGSVAAADPFGGAPIGPYTSAADPAHAGVANDPFLSRRGLGLDLDLAGGVLVHAGAGDDTRAWLTRARVGVLLFNEPSFLSLGVAGQLGPLASSSLGIELAYSEVVNGLTAQVGVFPLDSIGGTIVEAQVGWTVFAAEYQRRVSGPRESDQALVVVVHAPLGIIYQMLRTPPGVVRR